MYSSEEQNVIADASPLVTLTTDWGSRDYFAAMVKGKLMRALPNVRIVDLSHNQEWGDLVALMDMVKYGCLSFPEGTIHLIDVGVEPRKQMQTNSDATPQHYIPKPVLALCQGQYLICNEMRQLSWSLDRVPDIAVWLDLPQELTTYNFLARDLYCDVILRIASGAEIESLGTLCNDFRLMHAPVQPHDGDVIYMTVMSNDHYGNANTNLSYADFESAREGRRFVAEVEGRGSIDNLRIVCSHYNDVRMGNLLLTVSATGMMQLAMNGGSAAQLLGLRPNTRCKITFYN